MNADIAGEVRATGTRARAAARELAQWPPERKRDLLCRWAAALEKSRERILAANATDIERARAGGIESAMLDRLTLGAAGFADMVGGLKQIADLPDPVGESLEVRTRPNGLEIEKIRVPIGVIAIIYEARPNVTVDAAALCIKSSNAVILRGGSEARETNRALVQALTETNAAAGCPIDVVQLVDSTDREAVRELVRLEGLVDLVIPRGGEGLIRAVTEAATVPVLKHYKGVCHVYVDESADLEMALAICENAKCQRPGVCNALETVLVHRSVADAFLPMLAALSERRNVELRGDQDVCKLIDATPATEDDWYAEYLALILAVKIVEDLPEAVDHIARYGSNHTDAIVAQSKPAQDAFVAQVDSGVVMVNASTRFNDGGQFGMGAEMGISTDKLHARGPVGLQELTTYKYIVRGTGQVRP